MRLCSLPFRGLMAYSLQPSEPLGASDRLALKVRVFMSFRPWGGSFLIRGTWRMVLVASSQMPNFETSACKALSNMGCVQFPLKPGVPKPPSLTSRELASSAVDACAISQKRGSSSPMKIISRVSFPSFELLKHPGDRLGSLVSSSPWWTPSPPDHLGTTRTWDIAVYRNNRAKESWSGGYLFKPSE